MLRLCRFVVWCCRPLACRTGTVARENLRCSQQPVAWSDSRHSLLYNYESGSCLLAISLAGWTALAACRETRTRGPSSHADQMANEKDTRSPDSLCLVYSRTFGCSRGRALDPDTWARVDQSSNHNLARPVAVRLGCQFRTLHRGSTCGLWLMEVAAHGQGGMHHY